jgi:hypothetical protein
MIIATEQSAQYIAHRTLTYYKSDQKSKACQIKAHATTELYGHLKETKNN